MRIMIQFPEGLKSEALKQAATLEAEGHEIFISASPCYGACDVSVDEAKKVGAEKIIHYGHSEFIAINEIPVEYVKYPVTVPVAEPLEKAFLDQPALANAKTIILVTTAQHLHQLQDIVAYLERKGKTVLTTRGTLARNVGQVLGCDDHGAVSIAAKADVILYFGGGKFHPTGIRAGDTPLIAVDPYSSTSRLMNDELKRLEKKRHAQFMLASEAKTFGILVSTKPGQYALATAKKVKGELERVGKRAVILVSHEINWLSLENFRSFDAYVNTACPRIWEDYPQAKKPIINGLDALELARQLQEQKERKTAREARLPLPAPSPAPG